MMSVLWTEVALAARDGLVRYIAEDNLTAALHLLDHFDAVGDQLEKFPLSGRQGRMPGTREMVVHETTSWSICLTRMSFISLMCCMQLRIGRQHRKSAPNNAAVQTHVKGIFPKSAPILGIVIRFTDTDKEIILFVQVLQ